MTLRLIEASARLAARKLEQDMNNRIAADLMKAVASAKVGDGSASTGAATWHEAQHRHRNALVHGTSHPEALIDSPQAETAPSAVSPVDGIEWSGLPGDPFITLERTRGVHGSQPWDWAAGEAA